MMEAIQTGGKQFGLLCNKTDKQGFIYPMVYRYSMGLPKSNKNENITDIIYMLQEYDIPEKVINEVWNKITDAVDEKEFA